jgi:small subunit ribosomal protein S14
MANNIRTDKMRRKKFLQNLEKRMALKTKINNTNTDPFEKIHLQLDLQKLPRNSLKIRIKNRCILTGRTHGVVGFFNISRIKLRELIEQGFVPGLKKAVW